MDGNGNPGIYMVLVNPPKLRWNLLQHRASKTPPTSSSCFRDGRCDNQGWCIRLRWSSWMSRRVDWMPSLHLGRSGDSEHKRTPRCAKCFSNSDVSCLYLKVRPSKPVAVSKRCSIFKDVALQPNHHHPLGPGNGTEVHGYAQLVLLSDLLGVWSASMLHILWPDVL